MGSGAGTSKRRDVSAGFFCAQAFQQLAEALIPRIRGIPGSRWSACSTPPTHFGDLVACASNLAFALELYMKTLLAHLELPVPQDHDLRNLYDSIPQEWKAPVEDRYGALLSRWVGQRASITLAKGPADDPLWDDYPCKSKELPEVLARSRHLFQSWRYIYEFTEPSRSAYQLHQFEYGPLISACEAFRETLMGLLEDAESDL